MRGCVLSAVTYWIDEGDDYPLSEMQFVPVYIPDKRLGREEHRRIVNSFLGGLTDEINYYPVYESREARAEQLKFAFSTYFVEPYCDYIEGIHLSWGYERLKDQKERRKSKYDLTREPLEWLYQNKVEGKSFKEIEHMELFRYDRGGPESTGTELTLKCGSLENEINVLLKRGELYKKSASELSQLARSLDEQPVQSNSDALKFGSKGVQYYAEKLQGLEKAMEEEVKEKRREIEEYKKIIDVKNQPKIKNSSSPTAKTIGNRVKDLCEKMGIAD